MLTSTIFTVKTALFICIYYLIFAIISSSAATLHNEEGKLSLQQQGSPRLEYDDFFDTKKSLGVLKLVLSPLLVPLLLPIFIVGIGLLIFFLVTGASLAAGSFTGRNYHSTTYRANPLSSLKLAQAVLKSEECVKRISCEILRMTQGYNEPDWIVRGLKMFPGITKWADNNMSKKIRYSKQRGVENCKLYSCHAISAFQKSK